MAQHSSLKFGVRYSGGKRKERKPLAHVILDENGSRLGYEGEHEVKVGDIFWVLEGEAFPCDTLILDAYDPCVVAENEDELFPKIPVLPTPLNSTPEQRSQTYCHEYCGEIQFSWENLYNVNGRVDWSSPQNKIEASPFHLDHCCRKGLILASPWIVGVALQIGKQNKAISKLTNSEVKRIQLSNVCVALVEDELYFKDGDFTGEVSGHVIHFIEGKLDAALSFQQQNIRRFFLAFVLTFYQQNRFTSLQKALGHQNIDLESSLFLKTRSIENPRMTIRVKEENGNVIIIFKSKKKKYAYCCCRESEHKNIWVITDAKRKSKPLSMLLRQYDFVWGKNREQWEEGKSCASLIPRTTSFPLERSIKQIVVSSRGSDLVKFLHVKGVVCDTNHPESFWELFFAEGTMAYVGNILELVQFIEKVMGTYRMACFCVRGSLRYFSNFIFVFKKPEESTDYKYMKSVDQVRLLKAPMHKKGSVLDLSEVPLRTIGPTLITMLESGAFTHLILGDSMKEIPCQLGSIDSLTNVEFNPENFSWIPESSKQSWKSLKSYLKMIHNFVNWSRSRVMLVGQEAVGKTSLMYSLKRSMKRSLLGRIGNPIGSHDELSTNGIEIHSTVAKGEEIQLDIWDFGGQEVFYPTHQFFLSGKCVYIVVFRCDKLNESRVEYWLKTIKSISNNNSACITFLVGTHSDTVSPESIDNIRSFLGQKYSKQFYRSLQKEIFFINNKNGSVPELYEMIIQRIIEKKLLPLVIPSSWACFHQYITEISQTTQIISWSEFEEKASSCGISNEEIREVASFLGSTVGNIVYLGDEKNILGEQVVLQPQWLAKVLACVITFQHRFFKNGILKEQEIRHVLATYPEEQHHFILECLQKFNVLIPITALQCYIAPSLLPEEISKETLVQYFPLLEKNTEQGKDFQFHFLPIGFMSQVIGRILLIEDIIVHKCWRNGIIFEFQENELVYLSFDVEKLLLQIRVRFVNSFCDFKILGTLSYIIESTLGILYNAKDDTQFQQKIPCSHCLTEAMSLPFTEIHYFSFTECVIAVMQSLESLQCPTGGSVPLRVTAPDVVFTFVDTIAEENLTIKKLLGKGGFGSVYLADLKKDKMVIPVAVKELSLAEGIDAEQASAKYSEFFAEVSFMMGLNHECIVSLFGIRLKPSLGMVMEFLPLGDLFRYLKKQHEDFDWNIRLRIALDIAIAMAYMDSKQLVHRDLRTENILLYGNKAIRAKLADFGLSRQLITESKELGHMIWQYNPPERLKDNIYDIQSDVYSFGICCWEIASRKIPYENWENSDHYFKYFPDGHREIDLFRLKNDIIEGLRPSRALIDLHCPKLFEDLIYKCLSSDRAVRPSFSSLAREIATIAGFDHLVHKDL